MPGPVFDRGHVAAAGPSSSSCRTASPAGDGSGCAGRRAGARCAPRPGPRFSRQLPAAASCSALIRLRRPRRLGVALARRPPSSPSTAAPTMTLSGTRSSPCQCPRASGSRGPSRSDRSRGEDPGRRPPGDRAIVRKPPPSARTRGPRAAAPPLDRIGDRARGSSHARCRGGAGDVASADARPQARPSPDAGSGPRANALTRAGHCRKRITGSADPVLRGANGTPVVSPRPTMSGCSFACRPVSPIPYAPTRSPAASRGANPSSPSATSRSGIRTQDFAPGPTPARQRLRRPRRTGRCTSAGTAVAGCRQQRVHQWPGPCRKLSALDRRQREPGPARRQRHDVVSLRSTLSGCRTRASSSLALPEGTETAGPAARSWTLLRRYSEALYAYNAQTRPRFSREPRVCSRKPGQAMTIDPPHAIFLRPEPSAPASRQARSGAAAHAPLGLER